MGWKSLRPLVLPKRSRDRVHVGHDSDVVRRAALASLSVVDGSSIPVPGNQVGLTA